MFYLVMMLFIVENLPACRGLINEQAETLTITPTSTTELQDGVTLKNLADQPIDYNDKNLCGVRPLVKPGRIVGGQNARFGEWPWHVLLRESWLGFFTKNKCSGVLISSRFVISAAHCTPGYLGSLTAVFGENVLLNDTEAEYPFSMLVHNVKVHPEYAPVTHENEIALFELSFPIEFNAHIVPICMPPDEAEFTGRMAIMTGFGKLEFDGDKATVLQKVQMTVLSNSACHKIYRTAGYALRIRDSIICAGYARGQKGICGSDSGGPLVLQGEDGRWQLVGIGFYSMTCAAPFLPEFYMRFTYYKPWLKNITYLVY